jgi:hypothetical protein
MKNTFALFCLLALAACASHQWNSNIAAASTVIRNAGAEVDSYQKQGVITNATEDKLLDKLKTANGELRRADTVRQACVAAGDDTCRSADAIVALVRAVAAEVTAELLRAAAEKAESGVTR